MSRDETFIPSFVDIEAAETRLRGVLPVTPLEYSKPLSDLASNDIYLKLENLQNTGSFKIRGALNTVANLAPALRSRGLLAAAVGNQAQALAYAARWHGTPCTIVMPETASPTKVAAAKRHRANVVVYGKTYSEALQKALELQAQQNYTLISSLDNPHAIAGNATLGLEILSQLPATDAIVMPISSGSLAAGVALAVKSMNPKIKIYGVQTATNASRAKNENISEPATGVPGSAVVDELLALQPGPLTSELVQKNVDQIVTVDEEAIAQAIVLLMAEHKLVAEGAAGAALAAVIRQTVAPYTGNVAVIVSGGNVEMELLSRIISQGLTDSKVQ